MQYKHTTIAPLNDHIYILRDDQNATGYLVVGQEKAALIDTMFGIEDLRPMIREITDLPLVVLNTHGHGDHIGGNAYFDACYVSPADFSMVERFCQHAEQKLQELGLAFPEVLPINPGDAFDLGGITLYAIPVLGHTPGGICFFDPQDRTLFTGDAINVHLWMQLSCNTGFKSLVFSLEALEGYRDQIDTVLHGHAQGFLPAWETIDALKRGAQEILDGKTENDEPHTWAGGVSKRHVYTPQGALIVYEPKDVVQ